MARKWCCCTDVEICTKIFWKIRKDVWKLIKNNSLEMVTALIDVNTRQKEGELLLGLNRVHTSTRKLCNNERHPLPMGLLKTSINSHAGQSDPQNTSDIDPGDKNAAQGIKCPLPALHIKLKTAAQWYLALWRSKFTSARRLPRSGTPASAGAERRDARRGYAFATAASVEWSRETSTWLREEITHFPFSSYSSYHWTWYFSTLCTFSSPACFLCPGDGFGISDVFNGNYRFMRDIKRTEQKTRMWFGDLRFKSCAVDVTNATGAVAVPPLHHRTISNLKKWTKQRLVINLVSDKNSLQPVQLHMHNFCVKTESIDLTALVFPFPKRLTPPIFTT